MPVNDSFTPGLPGGAAVNVPPERVVVMAADGAIPIAAGTVIVTKAGVCAMTLDTPPKSMNGAKLKIISTTANAHTVTHTPGFGGGTTSRDVATFGGAISDGFEIVAYDGVWYVANSRNVSLG